MDKVIDFIVEYKFWIAVVVLLILILIVGLTGKFNIEGLEVPTLNQFINKEIYLKYIDGNTYYLSIAPNATCPTSQPTNECNTNVVILQNKPNQYSRMILNYNPHGSKRYNIMSSLRNMHQSYSQTNQTSENNKLCFGANTSDDIVSFDIEEHNDRYAIKYKKGSQYYYISLCDDKTTCGEFKRLCVYPDVSKAIYFDIELASNTETFDILDEESFDNIESNMPLEASLTDMTMPDLYSLNSFMSNPTRESLASLEGYSNTMIGSDLKY